MDTSVKQPNVVEVGKSDSFKNRYVQAAERLQDQARQERVVAACMIDEFGRLVRGFVPSVRCNCGVMRFDDGTRCHSCKQYYHRYLEIEDQGRL